MHLLYPTRGGWPIEEETYPLGDCSAPCGSESCEVARAHRGLGLCSGTRSSTKATQPILQANLDRDAGAKAQYTSCKSMLAHRRTTSAQSSLVRLHKYDTRTESQQELDRLM